MGENCERCMANRDKREVGKKMKWWLRRDYVRSDVATNDQNFQIKIIRILKGKRYLLCYLGG